MSNWKSNVTTNARIAHERCAVPSSRQSIHVVELESDFSSVMDGCNTKTGYNVHWKYYVRCVWCSEHETSNMHDVIIVEHLSSSSLSYSYDIMFISLFYHHANDLHAVWLRFFSAFYCLNVYTYRNHSRRFYTLFINRSRFQMST